ncbi:amidase family protein [Rhizodiscina lignyota]|uniref:amidase n=1 Tax=Rhizodiscina lignyota TaxID=1504668 RepID=A0A9P4IS80_9PEZI|nr:amidase family protein [Rhizodiscina lignyota]
MAPWEEKAKVARDYRDESLSKIDPPLKGLPDPLPLNSQDLPKQYLTDREYELTQNYDPIALLDLLRTKKVTSEELTKAFLRRAALAQYAVNCITELMWDEAIERAKYLDSLSEPIGPLHGLPISIKEYHSFKGKSTHGSYIAWIGGLSRHNVVNETLFSAGCVYYARTTGPQALMHLETINNIYGRTVNPYNRNLTPGGSSGGEAALVGFRGSVLGLGGDIGGSVRAPAGDTGLYGFKPTTGRIPAKGTKNPMVGRDSVGSTQGPLTVSRETINLFMKVILDSEPWRVDPSITVKPWTPEKFSRPLKIAIEWHDGVVKPHPPTTRALKEVAAACAAAGHKVVDWVPLDHAKGWDIVSRLYFPDGGEAVLNLIHESGEPVLPLTEWIINQPGVKNLTMHEYWALCAERDQYRDDYAKHWAATADSSDGEVDVILCPVTPGAAPLHETSKYWPYTSQWNLLDYPGVVFPVTSVDVQKDGKEVGYTPMNEQDRWNYELYEPEKYIGAPISLQIVGRRFMDEKVMAALEIIEKAMGRS